MFGSTSAHGIDAPARNVLTASAGDIEAHYAAFAKLSEETARRALREFLPLSAVDPDRISGVDEVVADAIAFKFITAPLTPQQRAELIRVPQPK